MRSSRMNGFVGEIKSSFLSCEKDLESIIKKLFVDSRPYSDELKRLLVINTKDCLDDRTNSVYKDKLQEMSVSKLVEDGYLKFSPRFDFEENAEVKSFIYISFDDFIQNKSNEYYKDHLIEIDILCNHDVWELGNYRLRPLKIAGYIDGILNEARLSGIGTLQFRGMSEIVLSQDLSGYCMLYETINGIDDKLENEDT